MAQRHKFSVYSNGGVLVAHVPDDDGSKESALKRLIADDPVWHSEDVNYQGMVKWRGNDGVIDFQYVTRSVA